MVKYEVRYNEVVGIVSLQGSDNTLLWTPTGCGEALHQLLSCPGCGCFRSWKERLESKVSASSVCSKRWPGSQAVYEL